MNSRPAVLHHLRHEGVDGDGVGGGVGGLAAACAYIVGNGGQQPAFISQPAEKIVEKGDRSGLAVGAGDAYKLESPGRVAVEVVCTEGKALAVGIYNRHGALCEGVLYVCVAVGAASFHCDEERSGTSLAGITRDGADFRAGAAVKYCSTRVLYDLL